MQAWWPGGSTVSETLLNPPEIAAASSAATTRQTGPFRSGVPQIEQRRSTAHTRIRAVLVIAKSGFPSDHGVIASTGYPRTSRGRSAIAAGMGISSNRTGLLNTTVAADD